VKAVDASVVIAAFAAWHEHHAIARKAMASRPRLVAHTAVEFYSVLPGCRCRTVPSRDRARFPCRAVHRAVPHSVRERHQELLTTAAAGQIFGGAVYDALIARTAAEHQATLLSLDHRATATYEAVGAQAEQFVP